MRKNFLQSMKEIFRDWDLKVMSYVMLVVTATCVITATVAWFTCSVSASVRNMEIQTADGEVIKVAVETGGKDVDVIRATGETPYVTIEMPVFANVTHSGEDASKKVLAPGTYGSFTIYVTPLKSDITHCEILPSFFGSDGKEDGVTYIDTESTGIELTNSEKEVIKQLVKGHILLFAKYDEKTKTYSDLLTETTPYRYDLSWDVTKNEGIETPITIYWYWPYEYGNLPSGVEGKLENENDNDTSNDYLLFDPEKIEDSDEGLTDSEKSRLYDFADTKIGTNVESVKFHFEVKAIYGSKNG